MLNVTHYDWTGNNIPPRGTRNGFARRHSPRALGYCGTRCT
jgi:hypothetical protein